MRPPAFWYRPPGRDGWRAQLLSPLAALYARETARRVALGCERVGVPVICVGNLTAGGTGKTPAVIAILQRLEGRDVAAHVVSRGYGGRLREVTRVDPGRHGAAEVGDEPLLLSAFAPVWIGRDRVAAARAAERAGATAIVMDDGLQSPGLAKDLSLVVVDAATGFGNERVIPAGPLREPVAAGLARADLLLAIGDRPSRERFATSVAARFRVPDLDGRLAPLPTGMVWQGSRAFAFAGIGRPEKFFGTLRELGAVVVVARALDDHQPLSANLLSRMEREARQTNAQLVTTEKDAVRLPASFRSLVLTLPVRLEIEDWDSFDAALDRLGL